MHDPNDTAPAPLTSPPAAPSASTRWTLAHRLVFRLAFAFFLLWLPPFPFDAIPSWGESLGHAWGNVLSPVVGVFGRVVLHRTIPPFDPSNGGGDGIASYALLALQVMLAGCIAVVWSVLDRRRMAYPRLSEWLHVAVRYSLAASMFGYGFAKVYKAQFPSPTPTRLLETVGDMSPMGIVWTLMGASTAYTFFAGAGEVLGATLLLFRRTSTLGAAVAAGVLANVVMLNFCYDIPVKIYSSELLAMALFVLAPDAARLIDVLVRRRPTIPRPLPAHFATRRGYWIGLVVKLAFIASTVSTAAMHGYTGWTTWGDGGPRAPIEGAYTVESFVEDGEPPRSYDRRWWRVAIQQSHLAVFLEDGSSGWQEFTEDTDKHTVTANEGQGTVMGTRTFQYAMPDADHLSLQGEVDGKRRAVMLKRIHSLLVERGFHWVNETPFNR